MNAFPILALALLLPGCSVAALMEDNNLDQRIQALDARVHDLEARQPVTVGLKPVNTP